MSAPSADRPDTARYVALLRGINVGGTKKVDMPGLRAAFEAAGMTDVRTYINSGNVIFRADVRDREALVMRLEEAVRDRTGVDSDIQVRSAEELSGVVGAIPTWWTNDGSMKCDVVFLQDDVDGPEILERLEPRDGIEDALYVPGAVVWRVDRANATRSRLTRIVGTPLYARVTVRNCNTVRRLLELLDD